MPLSAALPPAPALPLELLRPALRVWTTAPPVSYFSYPKYHSCEKPGLPSGAHCFLSPCAHCPALHYPNLLPAAAYPFRTVRILAALRQADKPQGHPVCGSLHQPKRLYPLSRLFGIPLQSFSPLQMFPLNCVQHPAVMPRCFHRSAGYCGTGMLPLMRCWNGCSAHCRHHSVCWPSPRAWYG